MEMICINCPMGCVMQVSEENGEWAVSGNQCKRGIEYAIHECTAPTRMVTSSLYIEGGVYPVVPIKTSNPIPKDKIFNLLLELKQVKCQAPIKIGDIIVENIFGLGVDIVATKDIKKSTLHELINNQY